MMKCSEISAQIPAFPRRRMIFLRGFLHFSSHHETNVSKVPRIVQQRFVFFLSSFSFYFLSFESISISTLQWNTNTRQMLSTDCIGRCTFRLFCCLEYLKAVISGIYAAVVSWIFLCCCEMREYLSFEWISIKIPTSSLVSFLFVFLHIHRLYHFIRHFIYSDVYKQTYICNCVALVCRVKLTGTNRNLLCFLKRFLHIFLMKLEVHRKLFFTINSNNKNITRASRKSTAQEMGEIKCAS